MEAALGRGVELDHESKIRLPLEVSNALSNLKRQGLRLL